MIAKVVKPKMERDKTWSFIIKLKVVVGFSVEYFFFIYMCLLCVYNMLF